MPKQQKSPKGWISGNVCWYAPKRKKPIAYSTQACSDLIKVLAEDHETIQDVYTAVTYDQEAKWVLQQYIDLGYGSQIARAWFD